MKKRSIFLLAIAAIVLVASPVLAEALYNVTDLGPLSGGYMSTASSINNHGHVVGNSYHNPADPTPEAILWHSEQGIIALGALGGVEMEGMARSINNNGQIVGWVGFNVFESWATLFDSTGDGNNIQLGKLSSIAWSINERGQIVGISGGRATLFDSTGGGANVDLGTLGGGYGYAGAIDNAAALAGDSCIIDSVNADEIQVPNAFWSASELGWLYTPGFSYILTGVLTNLGNSHIDGTSPLVTLEVYDGLPVEDANLLRSAQFHPADRSWVGGHFDPLVLTAGEHYFIGFRNVKDLWASHSYDGVPLPIYYGYDNDGTYPFTENGDVEYAMLKFQGTHIHPLRVPADYPTIQAAIDAAVDGDTVLVADGTYTGDGNRDIDFLGKAITVRSENGHNNCIIYCNGTEEKDFLWLKGQISAIIHTT